MNNFDIGIIGAGVAGAFASYKIAKDYKNLKTIVFDLGRPPMKRRRQLEGWLGCLPNSDGKLYLSDADKISQIVNSKKVKSSFNYFNSILSNVDSFKTVKDKSLQVSLEKKLKKAGYEITLNDHIQMYPKDIHLLSKFLSETIEKNKNINFIFDKEVKSVSKQKSLFSINCEGQEYKCKKLIIAVGRSGWRWCKNLYQNLGLIENNDIAKFGIRFELNSSIMKEFNKSNCTIKKSNDIEIGPLCWNGTVIPEDHVDLAISAFRSNENRWKTDKVSFSLIKDVYFPNNGFEQTDRIGKLTFLLANDRIIKEKVSYIINGKSKISIMKEYDWLKPVIQDLSSIFPEILSKGYFHVPTIMPMVPKINIGNNLETELDGMFVAGESAGIVGIMSAACTGLICVDSICK